MGRGLGSWILILIALVLMQVAVLSFLSFQIEIFVRPVGRDVAPAYSSLLLLLAGVYDL
jgi:hypothetical protein